MKYNNIQQAGCARNDGQGPPVVLDAIGSLELIVRSWIEAKQPWVK
ncbi:hypothetical protein [uncultured Mitsuokella sp.]|nr:hypothetical protein [uncultured Mitsuokella sp.]